MAKAQKQRAKPKKRNARSKIFTWIAIAGVAGLAVYGISQMSVIAFDENRIRAVNFSGLDANQKKAALTAANRARCTCGCGLGLAECVSVDMTCPIRESNIERIKVMVRDAQTARP